MLPLSFTAGSSLDRRFGQISDLTGDIRANASNPATRKDVPLIAAADKSHERDAGHG